MTYWQSAPAYSDEIAPAFHLFPYSPQSPAAPTVFIQFSDKSAATIIAPSLSDGNHFLAAEKTAEIIVFYFSSAKQRQCGQIMASLKEWQSQIMPLSCIPD